MIINEALARKYLPGEDPIGKHIRIFDETQPHAPWLCIVGVVGDEKRTTVYQELAWDDPSVLYRPAQDPLSSANVLARVGSAANRNKLSTGVQQAIAELDPNIPLDPLVPVTDLELQATAYPRFRATLLAAFAALALLLATIGLFGVLSQSVAQRQHEIGVRLALGAQKPEVVRMILKEGLLLTGSGILLGVAASWGLDRYLSALLNGVRPEPLLFAATALALLPAAFIAMYLPVRRAAEVDPMVALRYE